MGSGGGGGGVGGVGGVQQNENSTPMEKLIDTLKSIQARLYEFIVFRVLMDLANPKTHYSKLNPPELQRMMVLEKEGISFLIDQYYILSIEFRAPQPEELKPYTSNYLYSVINFFLYNNIIFDLIWIICLFL